MKRRTKKLLKMAVVGSLAALGLIHQCEAAVQTLYYEPAKVRLSGAVVIQQFYGPPNFGENPATDAKVDAFILKLDAPVDVEPHRYGCGSPAACTNGFLDADSFENVEEMELVDLDYPAHHLKSFIGKHVVIRGTLYERYDGNQNTDVLLIVNSIDKATP